MIRRPGLRAACVLIGASLLGVGAAAPAAGAGTSPVPKRCSALKGRDLLPGNPELRVVRVRYVKPQTRTLPFRGHAYLACAARSARVRVLGFSGSDLVDGRRIDSSTYGLGRSAGTWLVERSSYAAEEGSEAKRSVVDVATGRRYTFWIASEAESTALPPVRATALDASGRLAVVFAGGEPGEASDLPAGATSGVATFTSTGRRTIVDSGGADIVPSSLRLRGTVASWTHGTETRTVDLAAPGR
jgi:hypothetical protein